MGVVLGDLESWPACLRVYTKEFGNSLIAAWGRHHPHPTMRQKVRVDPASTDRQLFHELPTADVWDDAGLVPVYWYLREGYKECVPDAWCAAFKSLDEDLTLMGHERGS